MAAYLLFDNVEVTDAAALAEYFPQAAKIVAEHGGRYDSPAYQPLKAIRHRAARNNAG